MDNQTFVLGAQDPEMAAIETLLREQGLTVRYATAGGQRVHPGNAGRADGVADAAGTPVTLDSESGVVWVECRVRAPERASSPRSMAPSGERRRPGARRPPSGFLVIASRAALADVRSLVRRGPGVGLTALCLRRPGATAASGRMRPAAHRLHEDRLRGGPSQCPSGRGQPD
jgi:hypothetical protein